MEECTKCGPSMQPLLSPWGSCIQILPPPLLMPVWAYLPMWCAGVARRFPHPHHVLAAPPDMHHHGEMRGPESHTALPVSVPPAPFLTHSLVLWPHPFSAAERPLVLILGMSKTQELGGSQGQGPETRGCREDKDPPTPT